MQIRLSDLYKIMGGYDVEGNRTIAPEILQWLTSVQQQTTPETTYTQDGPSTTNETTYTFDKTFGNEFGEAPIGPDGQPLWIPDEQRSVGRTLGRMAATLGGAAVLGNAALIASAVGSLGVSAPAAEAATVAAAAPEAGALGGAAFGANTASMPTYLGTGSGFFGPGGAAAGGVGGVDAAGILAGTSGWAAGAPTAGTMMMDPAGAFAAAQAPGMDVANVGQAINAAPSVTGAPTNTPARPGTPGAPGGSSGQSVLEQIMGENLTPDVLMRLLSGGLGAYQQYNFGQDMLERANAATPNRGFYEDELKRSYVDPGSYLKGPDVQAGMDLTLQKLQSRDAAGGRLANDIGRQTTLNNYAIESLGKYRTGLAGIVGDNQRTYSGQNQTFQQGAQADNSYLNSILNAFSSRTGT